MKTLLVVIAFCSMAAAQLPDAPSAVLVNEFIVDYQNTTVTPPVHKFWDRQQKVSFFVSAGLKTADAIKTCHNLNKVRTLSDGTKVIDRERWMPTESCAATVALIGGGQAAQLLTGYWLHRKGHHKLERVLPWIASVGTSFALVYSMKRTR